jgi:hypothetical protein
MSQRYSNKPYDSSVLSEPIGDMDEDRLRSVFKELALQHPGIDCYIIERVTPRETLGGVCIDGVWGYSERSSNSIDDRLNRWIPGSGNHLIPMRFALRSFADSCTNYDQMGRLRDGRVVGIEPKESEQE